MVPSSSTSLNGGVPSPSDPTDLPIELPASRYFAITWGIPENYGGMTGAFLHRSRAFLRLAGVGVDVLTFEPRPDYPDVERSLRAAGELLPGMRLFNLWEWLRTTPLDQSAPGKLSAKHAFAPLDASGDGSSRSTYRGSTELSRSRMAADGETVLQTDYYRTDGTLFASDLRDTTTPGELGGRSIVICDAAGDPLRSFGSIWALYRYWLDRLRAGENSIMFVDSKTTANFMLGYRRPGVLTVHVVHSSHLVGMERPLGTIRPTRAKVFDNLGKFDAVVVLTSRQHTDITTLLGEQPNLYVVPNGREVGTDVTTLNVDRAVNHGVVLASLTARKRLGHAVTAIAVANRGAENPATLDIYGEGEERTLLERSITELGLDDVVALRGFSTDASERFADASFMLLSSTSEGFPLVLVESMAAGCIPIAYDIAYGPADIITDGENGYLVSAGDPEALGAAIAEFIALPADRIATMRRSAVAAAAEFSDRAVTQAWARVLGHAQQEAQRRAQVEEENRQPTPPPAPVGGPVARYLRKIPGLARGLRARK